MQSAKNTFAPRFPEENPAKRFDEERRSSGAERMSERARTQRRAACDDEKRACIIFEWLLYCL